MMKNKTFVDMIKKMLLVALFGGGLLFSDSSAGSSTDSSVPSHQLLLPRFASLKSSEVNLRTGPGFQYPIVWTLVRTALPVEIIAEFESWRQIRDSEKSEGWVHQSLLTGKRTVVVTASGFILKESPSDQARGLAYLEKGLVGTLLKAEGMWCKIKVEGAQGWFKSEVLWGI